MDVLRYFQRPDINYCILGPECLGMVELRNWFLRKDLVSNYFVHIG